MISYGLNLNCQKDGCGEKISLQFGETMVRFTGALEIVCPKCQKITTFIGKFGQDIYVQRAINDAIEQKENKSNEN